ncbi:MAG: 4-hydroxy-tetrahydrodipicolinate reductase [Pseudobdellovibrionaceae bacterium]
MKKIRIAVVGASGRMGQEISAVVDKDSPFVLKLAICRSEVGGYQKQSSSCSAILKKEIDVIIDFSNPELCLEALEVASKERIPFVSGTTGLSEKQFKKFESLSKGIPLLFESNMSLGICILRQAIKVLGKFTDADFQIEEIHHKRKKDTPSGTAITLQKELEKATGKKWPAPLSIRGGGVFGVHRLLALSEEEIISFEHTALNRKVFAKGALQAALWLSKQKAGRYQMSHVLGIE